MEVVKRNGGREPMCLEKITTRLRQLVQPIGKLPALSVDPVMVAQRTCAGLFSGISTSEIDRISSEVSVSLVTTEPDYEAFAARIVVSNLHKQTAASVVETFNRLAEYVNERGEAQPLVAAHVLQAARKHGRQLQKLVDYTQDYSYSYFGLKTLMKGYLLGPTGRPIERPQHMLLRVALGIWPDDYQQAAETYEAMSAKLYTHATPTLFNMGTPNPASASCYLLGTEDSVEGLMDTLKQCALISKNAGGIGLHVSNVRGTGALIRGTAGKSNGLVPMARTVNDLTRWINQGGKRNGALALYLEPWHVDVFDFVQLRRPQGVDEMRARDVFLALWLNDLFFERVEADGRWSLMDPDACPGLSDAWGPAFRELYTKYEAERRYVRQVRAQELWDLVLECQVESGMPYCLNKDAANAKSNQQNLGTVKSSNLCVAPETLLLTDKGHLPIGSLQDRPVNVWTGTRFAPTRVTKTGDAQEMVRVHVTGYKSLHCTPYHKFYVQQGFSKARVSIVEAKDLEPGMRVVKTAYPTITGGTPFRAAYTHGFFCGDGTYSKPAGLPPKRCTHKAPDGVLCDQHTKVWGAGSHSGAVPDGRCHADANTRYPHLALYGAKKALLGQLDVRRCSGVPTKQDRLDCSLDLDLPPKYQVPAEADAASRLDWLAGLADSDGCATNVAGTYGLQIASVHRDFLVQVSLMLQTLGCEGNVGRMHSQRHALLPDGRGQQKLYRCQACYRLCLTHQELVHLVGIGFAPRRLKLDLTKTPQRCARRYVKVVGVEAAEPSDTYCFNEPGEHKGVFGGIITGQCSEIIEVSDSTQTSVCNLASVALPYFVAGGAFDMAALHAVVQRVVRNLDRMLDSSAYPVEQARATNSRDRPLGVGVQGLADAFIALRLPFQSPEAARLNRAIFETIYHAALTASAQLAAEKGPYPSYAGSPASRGQLQMDLWGVPVGDAHDWPGLREAVAAHGLRNSLLVALMPTCSTSQILGCTESFQPLSSVIYNRRTGAGTFVCVARQLVKDLQARGLWSGAVKDEIIRRDGSVQGVAAVPQDLQELYRTVWEIPQRCCIDLAADRAPFIDQSQSMNLFLAELSYRKLSAMLFHGWRRGLKTLCYYLHIRADAKPVQVTLGAEACAGCAA